MKQVDDGMVGTEWQCEWLDQTRNKPDFSDLTEEDLNPLIDWCREYHGIGRFYVDDLFGQFYFEKDEDRVMFLLRWS